MRTLIDLTAIVNRLTANSAERYSWSEWKEIFRQDNVLIATDDTANPESMILAADAARQCVLEDCTFRYELFEPAEDIKVRSTEELEAIAVARKDLIVTVGEPPAPVPSNLAKKLVTLEPVKKLTVEEWRAEYKRLLAQPPVNGFITTIDESPVRIDIECVEGKAPTLLSKVSLPNVVCGPIGWYGQRENDYGYVGWTVVLCPKSRDECLRRFDITRAYGLVKSLRIIRMSGSRQSLIAEVAQWHAASWHNVDR